MAGRGRRGPLRSRQRGGSYQSRDKYTESDNLETKEIILEEKTIIIELKSNDQGLFFKFLELQGDQQRGRIVMSAEKAIEFRSILNEFVAEYERLPEEERVTGSERLKTETFNQGRRRYYVDLRQNERGRFLKVTMLAGNKTFIAIPGESISSFRDHLISLLDKFATEIDEGKKMSESSPRTNRAPLPPPTQTTQVPSTDSRELRVRGKRFYFDVEHNDRGTFVKLTEVLTSGRRNRINIPQRVWVKMGTMFESLAKDYPPPSGEEEESAGSVSDES